MKHARTHARTDRHIRELMTQNHHASNTALHIYWWQMHKNAVLVSALNTQNSNYYHKWMQHSRASTNLSVENLSDPNSAYA